MHLQTNLHCLVTSLRKLRNECIKYEGYIQYLIVTLFQDIDADKLFFLNFAQVWCGTARPEALRSKLKTAVHAPGKYRCVSYKK